MPDSPDLPKMMLGFVVRRFVADLGREPSPAEFAAWANRYRNPETGRETCLFGRPISDAEAAVILRHRGRPVSARSARPHETLPPEGDILPENVLSLDAARARLAAKRRERR